MKKRISLLLLSWIAAELFLLANMGSPNDGPIEIMGGSAAPMSSHPSIRMDSEEVTIRLGRDTYTVDAVFHFFNTGATTTEWVGFPKRGKGMFGEFDGVKDFDLFDTWVNEEKVQFIEPPDRWRRTRMFLSGIFSNSVKDYRWLVKRVTFPGNASTTTRVRYVQPYWASDARIAYYIFGTGSHWKGPIGKATFTIDCNGVVAPEKLRVEGLEKFEITTRRVSDTAVTYEVSDFEPDPDAWLLIVF